MSAVDGMLEALRATALFQVWGLTVVLVVGAAAVGAAVLLERCRAGCGRAGVRGEDHKGHGAGGGDGAGAVAHTDT